MSKFSYHDTIPASMLEPTMCHFEPNAWMIPAWCSRVNVLWQDERDEGHDGASMCIEVKFEYRYADITIYPAWYSLKSDVQRSNVVHELIHLHVDPVFHYAQAAFDTLLDGPSKALVQQGLRATMEGTVQDLTETIFERIAA